MESNREGVAVKNRDGGGDEQTAAVTEQQSINNLSTVPIRQDLGATLIDRNRNPTFHLPFPIGQVGGRFCGSSSFFQRKTRSCTIEKCFQCRDLLR